MVKVILKKRVYWWRFFFDTFHIPWNVSLHSTHMHVVWVCRLMLPCADNYRPPKARNDNVSKTDWWTS